MSLNRIHGIRWLTSAVWVLVSCTSLLGQSHPPVAAEASSQGKIETRTYHFEAADKDMEYAVYVPKSYDKEKATPLVVVLHGLGSNPKQILGYPGMVDQAEKYGTILGAPMGYNSRGWYGNKPPRSRKTEPANLGELSEKDVMNVLELLLKEFNVDQDRVYLTGHSMGGGGTWHLGIKYPKLWAGLAPIAPAIYVSSDGLKAITHLPVIVVQGDRDRLVPVEGARRWVAKMKELEMVHEYLEVEGGDHIKPAFQKLPEVFDFLMQHRRTQPAGDKN